MAWLRRVFLTNNGEKRMSKTNIEEIVVDGETYVKKSSLPQASDDYFIVRTYSAGVFAGEIVAREGQEVTMRNARRLWYWDGAASLSQLAVDGVSKPENCKFPCEVPEVTLLQAVEILPCTKKARKSLAEVKIWKA